MFIFRGLPIWPRVVANCPLNKQTHIHSGRGEEAAKEWERGRGEGDGMSKISTVGPELRSQNRATIGKKVPSSHALRSVCPKFQQSEQSKSN
jgi:hypothetical protein